MGYAVCIFIGFFLGTCLTSLLKISKISNLYASKEYWKNRYLKIKRGEISEDEAVENYANFTLKNLGG